jgi:flagellin-like hook-associated protein FlgL
MLQRIRELAVQSASGTYSDDDRTNLQTEVTELTARSQHLSDTKFNGVTSVRRLVGRARRHPDRFTAADR